jgi:hypothetical protein
MSDFNTCAALRFDSRKRSWPSFPTSWVKDSSGYAWKCGENSLKLCSLYGVPYFGIALCLNTTRTLILKQNIWEWVLAYMRENFLPFLCQLEISLVVHLKCVCFYRTILPVVSNLSSLSYTNWTCLPIWIPDIVLTVIDLIKFLNLRLNLEKP